MKDLNELGVLELNKQELKAIEGGGFFSWLGRNWETILAIALSVIAGVGAINSNT